MNKPFRKRSALAMYDTHVGPNMTPMVDIVMVILIFFMASAVILGPEWWLRTNLARPGPAASADEVTRVRITLARHEHATEARVEEAAAAQLATNTDQEPRVVSEELTHERGDMQWLRARLEAITTRIGAANVVVLIAPEADVPYEDVVAAHEACAAVGLRNVGLMP